MFHIQCVHIALRERKMISKMLQDAHTHMYNEARRENSKRKLKREIYFKLSADDAKKWNLIFISFRMNCHTLARTRAHTHSHTICGGDNNLNIFYFWLHFKWIGYAFFISQNEKMNWVRAGEDGIDDEQMSIAHTIIYKHLFTYEERKNPSLITSVVPTA